MQIWTRWFMNEGNTNRGETEERENEWKPLTSSLQRGSDDSHSGRRFMMNLREILFNSHAPKILRKVVAHRLISDDRKEKKSPFRQRKLFLFLCATERESVLLKIQFQIVDSFPGHSFIYYIFLGIKLLCVSSVSRFCREYMNEIHVVGYKAYTRCSWIYTKNAISSASACVTVCITFRATPL